MGFLRPIIEGFEKRIDSFLPAMGGLSVAQTTKSKILIALTLTLGVIFAAKALVLMTFLPWGDPAVYSSVLTAGFLLVFPFLLKTSGKYELSVFCLSGFLMLVIPLSAIASKDITKLNSEWLLLTAGLGCFLLSGPLRILVVLLVAGEILLLNSWNVGGDTWQTISAVDYWI